MHGHLRLVAQPLVEPLQERATACEHDSSIHDVRCKLGWRLVERRLDRVDDLGNRILERATNLFRGDDHRLRKAREHVAPAHLGLHLLGQPIPGAHLELDLLGCLLPDKELVLLLDVSDDRVVHLVPTDSQRLRDDYPAEGDHRHLGRAAADVDDHVPGGLADRKARADCRSHRLLDQIGLAGACGQRRILDRALLDSGHAGRHTDDHARVRKAVLVHLLDEVAQHLLRDVEVGDDAVLERTDRRDRARRAPEHAFRLDTDGVDVAGALVDRDDGRLGENDAPAANVDERVCGAEVDGHIAAAEAGESVEPAHGRSSVALIVHLARALHLVRLTRTLPVRVEPRFFSPLRPHPDGALRAGKGS